MNKEEVNKELNEVIKFCTNMRDVDDGYARDYSYKATCVHKHSVDARLKAIECAMFHDGRAKGYSQMLHELTKFKDVINNELE
jgi:hypothetical protein